MTLNVRFLETSMVIKTSFGEVNKVTEVLGGDLYEGLYDITPTVDGQTLETENKLLLEDVKINAIPYFDVSNTSGGSTVYIGSEVT